MNAWALLSDHRPRFAANVASAASRNSDLTLCGAVKGSRPSSRAARRLADPMARGLRGVGRGHPPSLRSTRLPYRVFQRLRRPLSAGRPVRRGAVPHHRPAADHPGVLSRSWQISSGTDARCRRECGHGKAMAPDDDPDAADPLAALCRTADPSYSHRSHSINWGTMSPTPSACRFPPRTPLVACVLTVSMLVPAVGPAGADTSVDVNRNASRKRQDCPQSARRRNDRSGRP